jgi:hypothetical protein
VRKEHTPHSSRFYIIQEPVAGVLVVQGALSAGVSHQSRFYGHG